MTMRYRDRWLARHYRALAARGEPLRYSGRPFDDFAMRPFLEVVLGAPSLRAAARPRALEYGTGTGSGACLLAERGLAVDAIDVSPDAIELARRFARERGL